MCKGRTTLKKKEQGLKSKSPEIIIIMFLVRCLPAFATNLPHNHARKCSSSIPFFEMRKPR